MWFEYGQQWYNLNAVKHVREEKDELYLEFLDKVTLKIISLAAIEKIKRAIELNRI